MTPASVVERISELLNAEIGLRKEPNLQGRLGRCVRDAASSKGMDFETYFAELSGGGAAMQDLLDRVTVQESAFFRHPEHFALLAGGLRDLGSPVNIWSAACANGQEAFSLAMLLVEQGLAGTIFATDLSDAALQRTVAARYVDRELTGLSPERIARHLTPRDGGWMINQNVRDRVRTLRHNLLDSVPTSVQACQVVFCRNVLIYLSAPYSRAFLSRVADAMPGATLFLGAAESIWQLSDRYDTVVAGDTFSYRLRRASPTRPASVSPAAPSRLPRPSRTVPPPVAAPRASTTATDRHDAEALRERQVGQLAAAAGDLPAAVIAFRKCVYSAPGDPIAHLHLALALDSLGAHASAQRAYAAARHAMSTTDPAHIDLAVEGYTSADVYRLLDSRQER